MGHPQPVGDALTVAPLTTIVDPLRYRAFARAWAAGHDDDTAYLYAHQLAEADLLALNKVDLLGADVRSLVSDLTRRNPSARVVAYSARTGSVTALVDRWLAGEVEDRLPLLRERVGVVEVGRVERDHPDPLRTQALGEDLGEPRLGVLGS